MALRIKGIRDKWHVPHYAWDWADFWAKRHAGLLEPKVKVGRIIPSQIRLINVHCPC
jgi:hypothetical protein